MKDIKVNNKIWKVYLAGEIHTNWREEIISQSEKLNLPIEFSTPETNHEASDNCGVDILGAEEKKFWQDHKGALINAIKTKALIKDSDIVVVCFGEKYRQWNTAFDAGFASAMGKSLIILHPEEFIHALKEIDAAANAVAENTAQVVEILKYVTG